MSIHFPSWVTAFPTPCEYRTNRFIDFRTPHGVVFQEYQSSTDDVSALLTCQWTNNCVRPWGHNPREYKCSATQPKPTAVKKKPPVLRGAPQLMVPYVG